MKLALLISGLLFFANCFSQTEPPALLFKEDWNQLPPYDVMTPYSLTQKDILNTDLIQRLYGPAQDSIKKRHHGDATEPYYIYTGFCRSNWALALSNKNFYVDLTGNAIIRCRVKNSGFRQLHLIIQTASGNWFISDQAAGPSSVWSVHDFIINDIKWSLLNINTVTPLNPVDDPETHYGTHWLGQIDKIGFTDLMNGGLSDACTRVDWIEVYALSVKR